MVRLLLIIAVVFALGIYCIQAKERVDAVVTNEDRHFVDIGFYTATGALDTSTKIGPRQRSIIPGLISGDARIYRSSSAHSPPIAPSAKPLSSCRFSTHAKPKLYFEIRGDKIREARER